MRRVLGAIAAAFGLLTRFPIASAAASETVLARSTTFFPLAGAALGAVLASVGWLAAERLPPSLTAVGVVAALALLTGGVHLDGLADVFDGLAGGERERDRILAIMRDSRIGAAGASAVSLALIAKVLASGELIERHDLRALVAFPVAARWAVVPLVALFPYARREGLGKAFAGGACTRDVLLSSAVALPVILYAGAPALVPLSAALGAALGLAVWLQRRLGGLTGDVYGAAIELAEIAYLIGRVAAG